MEESGDRYLYLLRHAKSSWDDPTIADRDRPLAPRGRRASEKIAEYVGTRSIRPQLVLCSPAKRARQTLKRIAVSFDTDTVVRVEPALYGATEEELLGLVRRVEEDVLSVMLVGHNPALQELALTLAREGPLREQLERKFPTGALASLAFRRMGWNDLEGGLGELVDVIVPRSVE